MLSKGCGLFGALGIDNKLTDVDVFTQISPEYIPNDIKKAHAAWSHSGLVTEKDEFLIFGMPYDFQNVLRRNRSRMVAPGFARFVGQIAALFTENVELFVVPTGFEGLPKIEDVICSAALTVMLTKDGDLFSFGNNRWGQIGSEHNNTQHIHSPTRVSIQEKIVAVDAGLQHCIALSEAGNVYTWGKGVRGQLGNHDIQNVTVPEKICMDETRQREHLEMTAVSAGFNHTVALGVDGRVYIWGKGMSVERKDIANLIEAYSDQIHPRNFELPDGRKAVAIYSSNFSTVIVADDRSLWIVGIGEYDRNTVPLPIRVDGPYHGPYVYDEETVDDEGEGEGTRTVDTNEEESDGAEMRRSEGQKETAKKAANLWTLPANARIRKGHKRVLIMWDEDSDDVDTSNTDSAEKVKINTKVYEVILHSRDSFLRPVEIEIDSNQIVHEDGSKYDANTTYRIVDFSQGWEHSIIVVSPE